MDWNCRQKALRDLTERLNRQKADVVEWPDLDEDGGREETARPHASPQQSPMSFASDELRHSVSEYSDAPSTGGKPLLVLDDSS